MLTAENNREDQITRIMTVLPIEENPIQVAHIEETLQSIPHYSNTILDAATTSAIYLMTFCNHECKGKLATLLNINLSNLDMITGCYFDKNDSTLKWTPRCMRDLETMSLVKSCVNEDILVSVLKKVQDNYVEKLIFLVRLFYTSYQEVKKFVTANSLILNVKDPTRNDAKKIHDNILEFQRHYLLTGVEHFDPIYLQKFNQENLMFNQTVDTLATTIAEHSQPRIYKPASPELDRFYGSEFAAKYFNHSNLEVGLQELREYGPHAKQKLYGAMATELLCLMHYTDRLSNGYMLQITGIPTPPDDKTTLKFINILIIDTEYALKQNYADKLKFLVDLYVNAYTVLKPTRSFMNAHTRKKCLPIPSSYKIDKTKIKDEIDKLVRKYQETNVIPVNETSEEKPIPVVTVVLDTKKLKKKKEKTNKVNSAPPPLQTSRKESSYETPSKLESFQKSYLETKRLIDNLDSTIRPLHDNCQTLQNKLEQTLQQDEKGEYISEDYKKHIAQFKTRINAEVEIFKKAIQAEIKALEYKQEDKLAANEKAFANIKTTLNKLQANQVKLLNDMESELLKLDHIIPKKSARELAAETLRFKKEEKKKLAEAEELKKSTEKAKKPERPKPPAKPLTQLQSVKQTAAKKPEIKKSTEKKAPADEKLSPRIQYLNQACIHLMYIHKLFEMYITELSQDVTHYALLYNIFRCFQSLKMYQTCGGDTQEINSDEVINLRNMIIHHGASAAHPEEVIQFAKDIKGKLSKVLSDMKGKKAYLISHELNYEDRQGLLEFSGFANHNALVIEESVLYKKLQQFHEGKDCNNDSADIFAFVTEKHIPAMQKILTKISKENPSNIKINRDLFIEKYLFELQALRMLATMCGEVLEYFQDYRSSSLYAFLCHCRVTIRNAVAHDVVDSFDPIDFYMLMNVTIGKMSQNTFQRNNVGVNSAMFFHRSNGSGSAMDDKYDKLSPNPSPAATRRPLPQGER